MRALITGVGGFVGRHLLASLREAGDDVCGIGRAADCANLPADLRVYPADLLDRPAVEAAGRDARFVIPSFAKQLAEIEAGERPPILRVGNLVVWRDFTAPRDMVRAHRR